MEQNRLFVQFLRSRGFESIVLGEGQKVMSYTTVEEEHTLLYEGTVCRDLSANALLSITGGDALDFLHRISTNDLRSLQPYETRRTLFTNDKGRLLDSTLLMYLNDHFVLMGSEGRLKLLQFWLKKYIITDDVKLAPMNDEFSIFEFRGSEVTTLFLLLFGDSGRDLKVNSVNPREFSHQQFSIIPLPAENGGLRYLVLAKTVSLINLLNTCLESKNIVDLKFIGDDAYNVFRVENGIPGTSEINDEYNPHELLLLSDVSFSKGCYIGQEVIARLDSYNKVQRQLRNFILNADVQPALPLMLYDENNNEAGQITSLAKSGKLNAVIGLGFTRKNYSDEGTELFAKNGHAICTVSVKMPGRLA